MVIDTVQLEQPPVQKKLVSPNLYFFEACAYLDAGG